MKQIYLVRHTTPEVEKGTCYGQTDLPVASSFIQELAEIQNILPDLTNIPLYTSPLQRCKQLAQALSANRQDDSLIIDHRLMEMHFGDWEMQRWADISPDTLQKWMHNFIDTPTPNGESHRQVHNRSLDFWNEKLAQDHDTYCIVTHYGVMQNLLAHLLHIPLDKLFRIDMGFGAIVRITFNPDGQCKVKFLR